MRILVIRYGCLKSRDYKGIICNNFHKNNDLNNCCFIVMYINIWSWFIFVGLHLVTLKLNFET